MKKFLICLATLLAGTTGVKAEFDGYTGGLSLGATLQWKLPYDGGTMTIFGEDYQPMMNFTLGSDNYDRPWGRDAELAAKIQSIDMQKGINIGNNAFYGLSNLTTVKLHGVNMQTNTDAIYCIGEGAFDACNQLANINSEILTDLRYIGRRAFATTAIKSFTVNKPRGGVLPELLTTAGGFAIDLDREHCYIDEEAFAYGDQVTTVYMKDATPFTDTYNNFLNDHAYLVVDDAAAAATYRSAWTKIDNRIIYLEQNIAFSDEHIKEICVSNWDTNGDGELSYEEAFAVTEFGDAFKGDSTIVEFALSDLKPFVNCWNLASGMFEGCVSLEKITIPAYVTDIADDAFAGCTSLKEIHFVTAYPFKGTFTIQTNKRTHIIVPDAYLSTYDNTWTNKSELIIGESHIPFQCPETKKICVTNWDTNKDGELSYTEAGDVTSIGTKFWNSRINFFDEFKYFVKVTKLDNRAFAYSFYLISIEIPNTITNIGEEAFTGCEKLTYVKIPNSVKEIGNSAFDYCKALSSIVIPSSVTKIGSRAFNSCSSLSDVIFENGGSLSIAYGSTDVKIFSGCGIKRLYLGRHLSYTKLLLSGKTFLRYLN